MQRITRYEALPHRVVTLELALHATAMSKWERCFDLLVQAQRITKRREAQLHADLEALQAEAAAAGFNIDPSGAFALPESGTRLAVT